MKRPIRSADRVKRRRQDLVSLYHACQYFPTGSARSSPVFDPTRSLLVRELPRPAPLSELAYAHRQIAQYAINASPSSTSSSSISGSGSGTRNGSAGGTGGGPSSLGSNLDKPTNEFEQVRTRILTAADKALSFEQSWKAAYKDGNEPPLKARTRRVAEALFGTSAGTNAGWQVMLELEERVKKDKEDDELAQKGFEAAFAERER